MPDWLLAIVLALLGAGFGVSILSISRGADIWRGRTARTEARGIAFIERTWLADEWAKRVAIHRLEYYRDEQNPYLRSRIGDLEFIIRTELGPGRVPPWEPGPVMRPLPPRPLELRKGDTDDEPDTTVPPAGQ
jgi:hypothetical protein